MAIIVNWTISWMWVWMICGWVWCADSFREYWRWWYWSRVQHWNRTMIICSRFGSSESCIATATQMIFWRIRITIWTVCSRNCWSQIWCRQTALRIVCAWNRNNIINFEKNLFSFLICLLTIDNWWWNTVVSRVSQSVRPIAIAMIITCGQRWWTSYWIWIVFRCRHRSRWWC